jgi:hypothetical protein
MTQMKNKFLERTSLKACKIVHIRFNNKPRKSLWYRDYPKYNVIKKSKNKKKNLVNSVRVLCFDKNL